MKDDGERTPEQEREAQELLAKLQKAMMGVQTTTDWLKHFDDRQRRLIANCRLYTKSDPAGVPGHNLMIIIADMADLLDGNRPSLKKVEGR